MGKGDKRTRRGKIFKGSFGKKRPKTITTNAPKKAAAEQAAS
jgi:30S ribosomal protein S31